MHISCCVLERKIDGADKDFLSGGYKCAATPRQPAELLLHTQPWLSTN